MQKIIFEPVECSGKSTAQLSPNYEQNENSQIAPEFIRLPKPKQRCAYTGLSRTTLCELIEAGKIKATKIRKKGAIRGIVLIHRASLLNYLHNLAEKGGKV